MDYKSGYLYMMNQMTDLIEEMKVVQQEAEEKAITEPENLVIQLTENNTPKE